MVQALFATCKHILYGIENDKIEMGKLFKIIKRAMLACENSGHDVSCDFPEVRQTRQRKLLQNSFMRVNSTADRYGNMGKNS